MKKNSLLILIFILLTSQVTSRVYAEDKNPFLPYSVELPNIVDSIILDKVKSEGKSKSKDPLLSNRLRDYKIVGLIASEKESFAVIRTINNFDYYLKVGDNIGEEGGVVDKIHFEGVDVQVGENKVTLSVNNKINLQGVGDE